ncbi:ABC transporter ATP-binding protein [Hazenella coriacea]|uniref:ABC-type multidrug transport system ATPase subunit n=1 Tax=Hazenella coriacea TaxID=1179467 RepID=A0A4R3LAK2_9BACL|nr:ABC transporter ATP-binding protein [Hazenella coriacea]TCS96883.1 ABC-type multidrug transport system ATPase subunit [Hazenella coriacea]
MDRRLKIDQVTKQYKSLKALDQVTMEITPGIFGLLGPNGAGKTTLMRILTTVLSYDSGSISYDGISWEQKKQIRQKIGYLPQKFSLYKQLKVCEALHHLADLKGMKKKERTEQVEAILSQVNLVEHSSKKVSELSGGMVRRLGIAQALLGNPEIIIVDEPTTGLDPEERIRFRQLLRKVAQDAIVLLSTHIVDDIEVICDQVGILNRGKVLQTGSLMEIQQAAQGKVWELLISPREFDQYALEWNLIANQREGEHYRLRLLAETPPTGATPVVPSLEDSYLYLIGEKIDGQTNEL